MTRFALISAVLYWLVYIPFAYLSGAHSAAMPVTAVAACFTMIAVWTSFNLWRRVFFDWRVVLCGLFNSGIIISTIEAMASKEGPVFKTVLIIKAGVLALMFYADAVSKNAVRATSVVAGALAMLAIVLMNIHKLNAGTPRVSNGLLICYLVCVFCYAVKLPLFSKIKRGVDKGRIDFLVSHQTWAVVFFLCYTLIRYGLPSQIQPAPFAIGVLSQLSGLFGSAVLLSEEEHTATVPLKTVAAMTAGFIASLMLHQVPGSGQIMGFLCLLLAAGVLQFRGKNG